MLFGGYKASKLKSQLKMAAARFQMSANKKRALMKQQIGEIAILLAEEPPKEEKARISAEALIRDDNTVEAYEILQLNCELLSERVHLISHSKECPPDLVECVSTLIRASAAADIPELREIRKQFRYKYGKAFDSDAMANAGGMLNDRVAARLSAQPPPALLVQTYLEKIADQHEVEWKPAVPLRADEISNPMPAPSGYTVQVGGGSGLNTGEGGSGAEPGPARECTGGDGRPSAATVTPSFRGIPEAPRGPEEPREPSVTESPSKISSGEQSQRAPLPRPPPPLKETKKQPGTAEDIEEAEIHVPGVPKSPPGAVRHSRENDDDEDGSGHGAERAAGRARDPSSSDGGPSARTTVPSVTGIPEVPRRPEAPRSPSLTASTSTISSKEQSQRTPLLLPPAPLDGTKNEPGMTEHIGEVENRLPRGFKSPPGAVWYSKKNDDDDEGGSGKGAEQASYQAARPKDMTNEPNATDDVEEAEFRAPRVPKSPPGAVWYNKKNNGDDGDGSAHGAQRTLDRASARGAGGAHRGSTPVGDDALLHEYAKNFYAQQATFDRLILSG